MAREAMLTSLAFRKIHEREALRRRNAYAMCLRKKIAR